MGRREYQRNSGKKAWVGGALLLFLGACEPFWNAPEGRAQDFIETLVTAPADVPKQRDIANVASDRNPEDLLDLSARVSLDYLRAKQSHGVLLKFVQSDVRRLDAARRVVGIRATYLEPGTPMNGEVRFQVHAEKTDQGRWRIARVTGDN